MEATRWDGTEQLRMAQVLDSNILRERNWDDKMNTRTQGKELMLWQNG